MDTIRIMWKHIIIILNQQFILAGFKLSFGGLLLFSCGFFLCWYVVGKLFR